ncbi:MAG: hypothetical protein AAF196_19925 [Planctomycetota bacterium]
MSQALSTLNRHFAAACEEHDVRATLASGPEGATVEFEGQEGASPELMASVFPAELETAGVPHDSWRDAAALAPGEAERVGRGLARAIARMRVLLIEHQSFISGGLAWVFPQGEVELRERELAIYRFPRLGAVDVYADAEGTAERGIHIDVQHGDHGDTVSSGFYVPTLIRGDFTATIDYELGRWEPGAETVCFALFAQDVPSEQRTYVMRRTVKDGPQEFLANFSNQHFTEPMQRPFESKGRFRLARSGDEIECFHAFVDDPEAFVSLGRQGGHDALDLLIGCKTWTSRVAGPFEAKLTNLVLEGALAPDQPPKAEPRPDPRAE